MKQGLKPSKPRQDFPLYPADNGQWAKKVNGRKYYFGSWTEDPKGEQALREWLARQESIRAGLDRLKVHAVSSQLTLLELTRKFMEVKHTELLSGELADETFSDYQRELQAFVDGVGPLGKAEEMTAEHFAAYKRHLVEKRKLGPHRLATTIRYLRACFNYAMEQGWIGKVVFGAEFVPPNTDPEAIAKRKIRAGQDVDDEPIFTPRQIRWLLKRATKPFRAMILLALNCGIGPSDLAKLRWEQIDFESGRLSARRGKNGIRREAYLWKKTRQALQVLRQLKHNQEALKGQGESALVFITRTGEPYVRRERIMGDGKVKKIKLYNALSITFGRMVKEAKKEQIIPEDVKLTFYNLRHTYRTHADNCADSNAVNRTMGHALAGMARRYVRRPFKLGRLKQVARTVYRCLFSKPKRKPVKATPASGQPAMRLVGGDEVSAA